MVMNCHFFQVEVKIRIPDRAAYDKLASVLASGHQAKYAQENYFFDGSKQELNSQRAVLRLRFFNGNDKAVITVKVNTQGQPNAWPWVLRKLPL